MAEVAGSDVLFIEDDRALAAMYGIKLAAEGYHVRTVHDAGAGLAACRQRLPDLVILDLRLPGLHGLDLLAELRRMPGGDRVPVIVLSSYDEQALIDRGMSLGVLDHLVKPQTTPGALVEVIRHRVARGRRLPLQPDRQDDVQTGWRPDAADHGQ